MTAPAPTTLGRAFDLYRRTATSRSAVALVIANAIPLIGVMFFGWSLLTILVLFWVENGIVGAWNIPRILLARGSVIPSLPDMTPEAAFDATGNAAAAQALRARWRLAQAALGAEASGSGQSLPPGGLGGMARGGMALFFLFHYGVFWAVHGIFVFALPEFASFGGGSCLEDGFPAGLPTGIPSELIPAFGSVCSSPFGEVNWSSVWIGAVALVLSHGASFFLNYLGKREYLTASPARQMFAPYSRVVMLHVTIIFGAFVIAFLGAPIGALLILVIVKTAFDLGLHLREHRAAPLTATPITAPIAPASP